MLSARTLRSLFLPLTLSLSVFLGGCAGGANLFVFPGVHKIPMAQGNVIDKEKFDQLKVGMTKTQVQFLMGTPLVQDSFDFDRWDYLLQLDDGKGNESADQLTLYFENNQLVRSSGKYMLGE